jgi:hypothetical protein
MKGKVWQSLSRPDKLTWPIIEVVKVASSAGYQRHAGRWPQDGWLLFGERIWRKRFHHLFFFNKPFHFPVSYPEVQ